MLLNELEKRQKKNDVDWKKATHLVKIDVQNKRRAMELKQFLYVTLRKLFVFIFTVDLL